MLAGVPPWSCSSASVPLRVMQRSHGGPCLQFMSKGLLISIGSCVIAGNLCSILVSGFVCTVISLIKPDNFDWKVRMHLVTAFVSLAKRYCNPAMADTCIWCMHDFAASVVWICIMPANVEPDA